MKGKEMYGEKYTWPAEYLNLPDDAIVQAYPRKDVHIIVVGGEANPQMQALKFYIPETHRLTSGGNDRLPVLLQKLPGSEHVIGCLCVSQVKLGRRGIEEDVVE